MVEHAQVLVVGAGAAGLWAAARAAELGSDVLLLEKTPRTGTKVLASGGTRCNLTTTLGPEEAGRLFGTRAERFLRRALRNLPPSAVRQRFHDLDVPTVEEDWEKVFPASGRARDVRDALEGAARAAGVRILCDAAVVAVQEDGAAWNVRTAEGGCFSAERLLLSPGGRSYPRTGTTGDGYAWLAGLDLPVVPPVPALVPLHSPDPEVHALAGVSLRDVHASLVAPEGRVLARRRRPLLFTHTGLSGPMAMDLSGALARAAEVARERGVELALHRVVLDLAPDLEREELRRRLIEAGGKAGGPTLGRTLSLLPGVRLPRRLARLLLVRAGSRPDDAASHLDRARRHALVELLKAFPVPVDGTLGYERAEVTAGGLALDAVDPGTMEVAGRPGLHVFGELLDYAGPIGGLNFQAAFATAELAAVAATLRQ